MEIQSDFKELLQLLNAHHVRYIIVGAYALAFHGVPRATGDLDVWVKPDQINAENILQALDEFGFGELGLTTEDFTRADFVVQLGHPPVRVDFVTSITGVTWEEAANNAVSGTFAEVPVTYIGKSEFIKNKRAIGRSKDIADADAINGKD
jgi:hypothetical protein